MAPIAMSGHVILSAPRKAFTGQRPHGARRQFAQIMARLKIKVMNFQLGFIVQAMLIGLHARCLAETHVPIAMGVVAELFAAMVAAQCH